MAYGLKKDPLVIFSSIATGAVGAIAGGPVGAYLGALFGMELGGLISKKTPVDIDYTFNGVIDESYLSKKDKYSAFLSGNNGHVIIKDTQNTDTDTYQ